MKMLAAQAMYGPAGRSQADLGCISIGRSLFRTLPEDAYDKGAAIGRGGDLTLVADVRIDNRDELLASLPATGARAAELPDSVVMLRAFEAWGETAVERIVGDFAFALWIKTERRLLLGRDFLGQRPLHYHRGADFFAFASMPRGLHALAQVPYDPDRSRVAALVAFAPPDPERSFFEDIWKVQPGHLLSVTHDSVSSRRYWRPSLRPLRGAREGDYSDALRETLDKAVRSRLRGSGARVGAHLSGGLDSSAVAATAARQMAGGGGKVVAFTAVPAPGSTLEFPPNCIPDESKLAAATAAFHANIEHVLITTEDRSPLDALDKYFHIYERPFPNLINAMWGDAINDAAKGRQLKVLLIGQRGNLGMTWDGLAALPGFLARGRLIQLAVTMLGLRRSGVRWGTLAARALGPFLPDRAWQAVLRARGQGSTSTLGGLASVASGPGAKVGERAPGQNRPGRNGAAERLAALMRADAGEYNKGVLGAWGIDVRDPTADRRLIELCLSIPEEQFLSGRRPRGLARQAFADRLPAPVLEQTLRGYQSADWPGAVDRASAQLRVEVEHIGGDLGAGDLLNVAQMHKLLDDWPVREPGSPESRFQYRIALMTAVAAGHFLRKAGRSNG